MMLWYFASFAFGSAFFFLFGTSAFYVISILIFLIVLIVIFDAKLLLWRFVLCCILWLGGGFVASYIKLLPHRAEVVSSFYSNISGQVVDIAHDANGMNIILNKVTISKYDLSKYVKNASQEIILKLRIKATRSCCGINLGDVIELRAKVVPFSGPIIDGGYDFGSYNRFSGQSGMAYAESFPIVVDVGSGGVIKELRQSLYHHFVKVMGDVNGNFLAAILLGRGAGVDKGIMQNMRYSGISHILCISGLHLSLVTMLCFGFVRILLNLSYTIAHTIDTKIAAGIIAICVGYFYLMLSGNQVAATRAFIMSSFLMAGIISQRAYSPGRAIGISSVCILILDPQYVMHPSFQLSFVAVIALISGYEFYAKNPKLFKLFGKFGNYVVSNIYSSLVASLATTPIVLNQFHIISTYGVIANLVAVPVMSFCLMPFALISFVLYFVDLDYYPLTICNWCIKIIIWVAEKVTNTPYSVINFGYITNMTLFVYMFGFFWIALWKTGKVRVWGFIIVCISLVMMLCTSRPVVIFANHAYCINLPNELLVYNHRGVPTFQTNYWQSWLGRSAQTNYKINKSANHVFNVGHKRIMIAFSDFDCNVQDVDVIINATKGKFCATSIAKLYQQQSLVLIYE